jgi:hypothetical protein
VRTPSMLEQGRPDSFVRHHLMGRAGRLRRGLYLLLSVWIGEFRLPAVFSRCAGSPEGWPSHAGPWWDDGSKTRQLA